MRLQEYGFLFLGTAFISQSLSLNPRTESCTRLGLYLNMAGNHSIAMRQWQLMVTSYLDPCIKVGASNDRYAHSNWQV